MRQINTNKPNNAKSLASICAGDNVNLGVFPATTRIQSAS
jgi:hypothetical protein